MGRKPLAFCRWLFDLLGMKAGDSLIDLFPGTGIVSRAWAQRSPEPEPQLSLLQKEPSPRARRQLSLLAARVDFVDLSLAPARRVVEGLATRRRPGPPDASFGRERQKER